MLHEFSANLGFSAPHEILIFPEKFLKSLDDWLSIQEIKEEDLPGGILVGDRFVRIT